MSNNRFPTWNWPWSTFFGPEDLSQSFNNGWTFGNVIQVTNLNSTNPEAEKNIVSHYSYGRQIGRLMDAVLALADDNTRASKDERVKALRELAKDVEKMKRGAKKIREQNLLSELKALKHDKKDAWEELVKSVGARQRH